MSHTPSNSFHWSIRRTAMFYHERSSEETGNDSHMCYWSCDQHENGFWQQKPKNAANSCIIYPATDTAVLLVSMKSLLVCLTLLGITCAFRFPTRKDGKGCYQPSFDKGIKEVVWVNNFWCVLLSRFPSVSLVRGVPFLKQTDRTV